MYKLTCDIMRDRKICGDKCIGETYRNRGERVGKHINDCKGRKDKSVLWRHFKEDHNEEEQPYELKVVSTAPGDPLLRQLTEAILIEEKKPLMNAKDEWGNRNIPRKREPGERGSQA